MVLSSLLGFDSNAIEVFLPIYTLEKLLLFPETALMPLRKDGEFIWINYFVNIYSIFFSCWVHRCVLLLGRPNCDLLSVFFTLIFNFFPAEMLSVVWALAEMTPAYWGALVILFLSPIFVLVGVGLYMILGKFGINLLEIEIEIREKIF